MDLELLAELNRGDQARHPHDQSLAARMQSYELAFRMQTEVPGVLDLEKEDAATRSSVRLDRPENRQLWPRCLLARRLVERGVRFMQIYAGRLGLARLPGRIAQGTHPSGRSSRSPALLADLKRRGMLDETLVVWSGEFGRSPDNGVRGGTNTAGRDHNAKAMVMWLAGGGVRRGTRHRRDRRTGSQSGRSCATDQEPARDAVASVGLGRQQADVLPRRSLQADLANRRPADSRVVGVRLEEAPSLMPYSHSLADRVRHALRDQRDLAEKKMFGGLCFILRGNILVGIWEQSLVVRIGSEQGARSVSWNVTSESSRRPDGR